MYVKADIIHLGIVPRKQRHVVKAESSEGQYGKRPAAWFSILRPKHTRRQIAATRRSNKFCRVNKRILLKILSPRQNFVAATEFCRCNMSHKIKLVFVCDMLQRQNFN